MGVPAAPSSIREFTVISRQRRFCRALLACALPVSTLLTTPAQAAGATQFTYSPLFCQTFGGSRWIYPSGQISNKSDSQAMRVFCPLIHEGKHDHSGKLVISVVQANQNEKDENGKVMRVECRAFFNHPHANPDPPWNSNGWKGKSEHSNGVETATIELAGSKYLSGSHMIECRIPPRDGKVKNFDGESRIGSYKSGVD